MNSSLPLPQARESCLQDDATVLQAIKCLEGARVQIVFVLDPQDKLVGIVTNGDIRRYLLEGGSTSDNVTLCMNRNFRWANESATREELLKLFDLGLNAIPRLKEDGRFADWVTPQSLAASPEAPVLVRSRAPVRVSFGGGGSDLTYFLSTIQVRY